MATQEEIRNQRDLLRAHRSTLALYLKQLAALGENYVSPAVPAGIREARENIARIKQQLRDWGEEVENQSNDEEIVEAQQPMPGAQIERAVAPVSQAHIYWGEAPDPSACYGREETLTQLEHWILSDGCRLVTIAGMSGIGKTTLVRKLAEQVKEQFDYVYWQSLESPTPVEDLLADWMRFLSREEQLNLPARVDRRITLLIEHLSKHRCLFVLDNFEAVLRPGEPAGEYHEGYKGYGDLIRRIGESKLGDSKPQSCLLLISWEKPKEILGIEGVEPTSRVRSLKLAGLGHAAARQILRDKGLRVEEQDEISTELIDRCSGNPSALNAVATRIRDVFSSDPTQFLRNEEPVFDGVRDLLNQQFERLSGLEQKLMYWLAIEREATSPSSLKNNIMHPSEQRDVVNGLSSLQRRLLIETSSPGFFRLHNVVLEYVTNRFVAQVASELETRELALFTNHALVKAQAKEHVREMQVRSILKPIADRSRDVFRTQEEFDTQLDRILADLRERPAREQGYAGGNALNLLGHLKHNLISDYDFSHLTIWQAYLRDAQVHNVDFTGALVEKSVFAETFGRIRAIAFNSGRGLLCAGTDGGEIHLWKSVENGQYPDAVLIAHSSQVRSVAFSPDGEMLATGSADWTVKLWNVNDGGCLRTLEGHNGPVRSVAFRRDGEVLASASADQTVKLWNVNTSECISTLEGHTGWVRSVVFSSDGRLLASGSADQTVKLWRVATGECLRTLQGHADPIRSVAFSPDGEVLASGSADRTVKLWNVTTGACLYTLEGHTSRVRSVAFSADGRTLASGGDDQTVKVWDIETGACLYTLQGLTNRIWSVTFGLNGQMNVLASGGDDETIKLWDVKSGQCICTLRSHANRVRSVAFNPKGDRLASGAGYNSAQVWDLQDPKKLQYMLSDHTARVRSVTFSPSGDLLATGSEDSTVKLWDAHTGKCIRTLSGHGSWVRSLAFIRDGHLLASGSDDETIKIWDTSTGQCRTLHGGSGWVRSVAFSPDGGLLVSGSSRAVQVWDAASGDLLKTLPDYTDRVRAVAFSHDGSTLASSDNQMIRLWDVASWQCRYILKEHTGRVQSLAFSPDDRLLASGSDDETVKLWKWEPDKDTWECCRTLRGSSGWVRSVAFRPDGRTLASGGKDEAITLWNVETGDRMDTLENTKPYAGTTITGVSGLTQAQKNMLLQLGATERGRQ